METRNKSGLVGRVLAIPIVIAGVAINSACQYMPVIHKGKLTTYGKAVDGLEECVKTIIPDADGADYTFIKTERGFLLNYRPNGRDAPGKMIQASDPDGDGIINNILVLGDGITPEEKRQVTSLFERAYKDYKSNKKPN